MSAVLDATTTLHPSRRVPVFIVAGNHDEAWNYAQARLADTPGNTHWEFVASPVQLARLRAADVHFVGTWRERADADEIEIAAVAIPYAVWVTG